MTCGVNKWTGSDTPKPDKQELGYKAFTRKAKLYASNIILKSQVTIDKIHFVPWIWSYGSLTDNHLRFTPRKSVSIKVNIPVKKLPTLGGNPVISDAARSRGIFDFSIERQIGKVYYLVRSTFQWTHITKWNETLFFCKLFWVDKNCTSIVRMLDWKVYPNSFCCWGRHWWGDKIVVGIL